MAFSTVSGTGVGPGIIRVSLSCMARGMPIGDSRKQLVRFHRPLQFWIDPAGVGGGGGQGGPAGVAW